MNALDDSSGSTEPMTVNDGLVDDKAEPSAQSDDMLVVVFSVDDTFASTDFFDAMWPVEERAIEAIDASGLGFLDGNDTGANEYGLCFFGSDWRAMWKLLEPIMRTAPAPIARLDVWPAGAPDMRVVSPDD